MLVRETKDNGKEITQVHYILMKVEEVHYILINVGYREILKWIYEELLVTAQ